MSDTGHLQDQTHPNRSGIADWSDARSECCLGFSSLCDARTALLSLVVHHLHRVNRVVDLQTDEHSFGIL
jgi:hypothetical protein